MRFDSDSVRRRGLASDEQIDVPDTLPYPPPPDSGSSSSSETPGWVQALQAIAGNAPGIIGAITGGQGGGSKGGTVQPPRPSTGFRPVVSAGPSMTVLALGGTILLGGGFLVSQAAGE